MRWRSLWVVLLLGAAGCEEGVEAQPAPACTGALGCPKGSRCIDGVRCEHDPNAPIVQDPPREGPPTSAASEIPPPPEPTQLGDGGDFRFDGGPSGFDSGPVGFDAHVPFPGCDACTA